MPLIAPFSTDDSCLVGEEFRGLLRKPDGQDSRHDGELLHPHQYVRDGGAGCWRPGCLLCGQYCCQVVAAPVGNPYVFGGIGNPSAAAADASSSRPWLGGADTENSGQDILLTSLLPELAALGIRKPNSHQ